MKSKSLAEMPPCSGPTPASPKSIEKKDGREGGKKAQDKNEPSFIIQEQVRDAGHGQEENPQAVVIGGLAGGQYFHSINSHVPKEDNGQQGEI